MGIPRVLLLTLAALVTTAGASQEATAWPLPSANNSDAVDTHAITHVVPTTPIEESSAGFPPQDSSSSGASPSPSPVVTPTSSSGTGSGSWGGSNSSASGSRNNGPNVGDVTDNAGVKVPDVVIKPTFVPVPTQSVTEVAKQKELEAQEAQAKRAREVAGGQGAGVQAFTIGVGVAGVAAVAVIAVYMKKRQNEGERGTVAITSVGGRDSTPSVYNDPLGTRFSSIVMITPNGDGVCIL